MVKQEGRTMSRRIQEHPRSVRRAGVLASALIASTLFAACSQEAPIDQRTQALWTQVIKNDTDLKDVGGKTLIAQGGSIIKDGSGTYYWYGQRTDPTSGNVTGIGFYTSPNLADWTDGGLLLSATGAAGLPNCGGCGRPSVVYNSATGNYVMSVKQGGVTFYTSTSPSTGFSLGGNIPNIANNSFPGHNCLNVAPADRLPPVTIPEDSHLFLDDSVSPTVAYFVYTGSNKQATTGPAGSKCVDPYAHIIKLNWAFTALAQVGGVSVLPAWDGWAGDREAPGVFRRPVSCPGGSSGSCYYMFTSATAGWLASQTRFRKGSYIGTIEGGGFGSTVTWPAVMGSEGTNKPLPNLTSSNINNSYDTQHTAVIPWGTTGDFMYLGDRWSNKPGGSSGPGLNGRYPLTFDASGTPTINYLRCWHGLAAGGFAETTGITDCP